MYRYLPPNLISTITPADSENATRIVRYYDGVVRPGVQWIRYDHFIRILYAGLHILRNSYKLHMYVQSRDATQALDFLVKFYYRIF